jgi:hypothetical protein
MSAAAAQNGRQDDETSGISGSAESATKTGVTNEQTSLKSAIGRASGDLQGGTAAGQQGAMNQSGIAPPSQALNANSDALQAAVGTGADLSASAIAAANAEKTGPESGKPSTQQVTAQQAHRDGAGQAAQTATHVVLAQQAGAGVEASSLGRVPAGAEGAANATTAHAGATAATIAGSAADETFAAIDAGTRVGAPGWIHAGGRTAEAGFEDPALGWVGVRADLSGGSVHAALMPGSAEAAQALSGHLAGLNAYLTEQHTPVATLTLAASGGNSAEAGAGQSMQQDTGQNAQGNTPAQAHVSSQSGASAIASPPAQTAANESGGLNSLTEMGETRGVHISVMA